MNRSAKSKTTPRFRACFGRCALAALWLALFSIITGSSAAVSSTAKPQRIISICLQGDQLLLQLVPRQRIVALSALATDPDISAHWEAAQGIPVTHSDAEELIRLKPDLVLVSSNSSPLTLSALTRMGVRVLELGIPTDFDELREQIRTAGRGLGEEARAEEIVQDMDTRLARLKARQPAVAQRPTALFYFQDRFTPGTHTFANAILEVAGFRNLAATFSTDIGISTSMESILMARPQYLILTRFRETCPTQTQLCESQPLFRKLGENTKILSVSFRHLISPDPSNLELAEMLQARLSP